MKTWTLYGSRYFLAQLLGPFGITAETVYIDQAGYVFRYLAGRYLFENLGHCSNYDRGLSSEGKLVLLEF